VERDMGEIFPTAIAGILVMTTAWVRFATPKINQVSTTQAQFYWCRGAYVLAAFAFYAVLAKAIAASSAFTGFLAGGTTLAPSVAAIPAPYVAALIMTTLLPHCPGVAKIDQAVLRIFRALGSMPVEVGRLAQLLERSPYVAPGPFQRSIVEYIHGHGLPAALIDELRFVDSDSARARFTRNLTLYVEIQHLKASPGFQRFFEEFAAETAEFDLAFAKFVAQSAAFFAFSASVPADRQRGLDSLKYARITFKNQCADFNRQLCRFLAGALLMSSWASSDLNEHLKNLGFAGLRYRSAGFLPLNTLATIGVYIVVICAAGMWSSPPW
jgi:hypothetical protein